eukprot:5911724-Pyramimonas_sp.AAC.1
MAMSAFSGEVEGSALSGQHFSRPDVQTGPLPSGAKTPAGSIFDEGAKALSLISSCSAAFPTVM